MHDVEVLLLSVLPRYLRALTKNDGNFLKAKRIEQTKDNQVAEYITGKP